MIRFGGYLCREKSWTLSLNPGKRLSGLVRSSGAVTRPYSGRLDFSSELGFYATATGIHPGRQYRLELKTHQNPANAGRLDVTYRFNIDVWTRTHQGIPTDEDTQEWLAALGNDPDLVGLNKSMSFANLRITLEAITSFYNRQRAAGYVDLLETITATHAPPFTLIDFRNFANAASMSLRTLHLSASDYAPSNLSFTEFPMLLSIISNNIPYLEDIRITIENIDSAETTCAALLRFDTIRLGGRIKNFEMYCPKSASTPPLLTHSGFFPRC